jgi:hypothetical protein
VSTGTLALALLACAPRLVTDVPDAQVRRDAVSLYDFGPERPPINADDPGFQGPVVPDGQIPRMTIATATLKPNVPVPKDRIIARIRSERAYPPMGIAAGTNYIWRNSRDARRAKDWKTLIVGGDSAMTRHVLQRDARHMPYSHGDPAEPRLVVLHVHSVALGACLDDPMCSPSGHCGYY